MESKRYTSTDMVKENERLEQEAKEFGAFKIEDFREKEVKFIQATRELHISQNVFCEPLRFKCVIAFTESLTNLINLSRSKTQFHDKIPDSMIDELMSIFFDALKDTPEGRHWEILEENLEEEDLEEEED